MVKEVEAVVLVQSNGELRVGAAAELVVGLGLEVFPDIIVVIELAVDDSMDGAVVVMEGLDAIRRKLLVGSWVG